MFYTIIVIKCVQNLSSLTFFFLLINPSSFQNILFAVESALCYGHQNHLSLATFCILLKFVIRRDYSSDTRGVPHDTIAALLFDRTLKTTRTHLW